jgi:peptidoglycan/xylan/chitin deacetylase (PgdA/CDA1 family)
MNVTLITNGDRERPWVALTFDLCQRPTDPTGFDEGIYNVLLDYESPATFFLGGDWMRTHIEETRLLAAVPFFELGNHSWSHPDMPDLEQEQMTQEILRTQNMMYQLTGQQGQLFRLPAGQKNDLVLGMVAYHGLYNIYWDVVLADPIYEFDAEVLLGLVVDRVQNGSIILMHANERGWHTAEALPGIIEYLRGEGYCLVTVSQLLELDPPPQECNLP